jgi:hypothetical protein
MSLSTIFPFFSVEIGFGADAVGGSYFVLDDPAKGLLDGATYLLAPTDVFVDVTEFVSSIGTDRGRARELDEYNTGTVTVVLNDTDRTFDPSHSGSPYAGSITPMRRIKILWNNEYVFQGWVEDWSVSYEPGDTMSRVTLECVDGFAILANQQLDEIAPSFAGDLPGPRIERVLDSTEVNFPATRAIDDGNSTLGATTFGMNALTYIQACAKAEGGYLFVAADGTLTFRNRQATLNADAAVVFSDDPTSGIPYRNLTQRSAADLLFTRVTGASETTSVQVDAVDSDAYDDFLIRTLPLGTLFTADDSQTQALVDSYLERFSTVEQRFQSATINMARLSLSEVATIMALDLSDIVTVERMPLNTGSTISRLSIIDGIKHRISASGASWMVELSFANADTRSFLTLDDAVFGVLDANRVTF